MEPIAPETNLQERYQIRTHLAGGGSGDAYLAWDTYLHREVVIKRVRTEGVTETDLQSIAEEASKMAAIRHPNIVAIYDFTYSENAPCIVMEYIHGQTLEEREEKGFPLTPEEFVELARQTLDALIAAHHAGLIHRDLKPSNIMLTNPPSGMFQARLLDFGMAKFISHDAPSPQTVAIDGSITGSIFFISPEQLNHKPVDARSDLYSLGCTLYYAASGQRPFQGDSVGDVITAHLTERVEHLQRLRPDFGKPLCDWVMKMMALKAESRYANSLSALKALRSIADPKSAGAFTGPIPAPVETFARPKPKFGLWVAVAAVVALIAAAGAWLLLSSSVKPAIAVAANTPAPVAATPEPTPIATPQPSPAPTAVAAAPPSAPPAAAELSLKIVGSNTIGAKLAPALMEAFLKKMGATDIKSVPGDSPEEKTIEANIPGIARRQAVSFAAHGSATAFTTMQKGGCEIGMASRPIKAEEAQALLSLGDMQSPACEHVVGLDGLAVIVNKANGVASLSIEQLAEIFSGAITDWSQVGGNPGPIALYARDDKSGTYDTFKTLVLGQAPLNANAQRFEDSAALSEAVAADANGIGFIGLPYVRNARALALSEAGSAPLLPSPFTVATEDYPLSRRLFFYTPAVPSHSWVPAFVEFALSDEGQAIVESMGFISQSVHLETPHTAEKAPAEYLKLTGEQAERLSVTFRFRSGSAVLDAKAIRDLDRVMRFVARPENRTKRCLLLGFSDNSGAPSANEKLSLERAGQVASQLGMRGLPVGDVRGFGPVLPIATNDTAQGREKNRRVEIWLR